MEDRRKGKKILVLGGTGMLGHKLGQTLSRFHETYVTLRSTSAQPPSVVQALSGANLCMGVAADDFASVRTIVETVRPDVTVNCIGVVKQLAEACDAVASITTNSLFPHQLANLCGSLDCRVITVSTDCVFSGLRGNYSENDQADPIDLYGRSKWLGELNRENALTIRTSIIGRQILGKHGLVEWLLSQRGKQIKGYTKAIFSGFTTLQLSNIISDLISDHANLEGVWHVSANPISKFDLLNLINNAFGLGVSIQPDESFQCDRSLNSERFRETTGIVAPPWADMINAMHSDSEAYSPSMVSQC